MVWQDQPLPAIHIIQVDDSDDYPEKEQKIVIILELIDKDQKA